jgi:signal transduction histidine kinase
MTRPRDLSVATRLTLLSAIVSGALAVTVFVVVPPMVERDLVAGVTSDTVSITQMISAGVSASVFFGDAGAAQGLLDGLANDREILYAVARLRDGSPLASYKRPNGPAVAERPLGREFRISEDGLQLRAEAPVVANGQVVGSVDLSKSLANLRVEVARMRRNLAWLSLLLFAAGTGAAYSISSFVLGPLRVLAATADRVARGDLTQRAALRSGDEFGRLATVFNRMVESLESAQGGLEIANRNLEVRVNQRTRELEDEIVQRKRAEEALTESERRYRSLFDENLSGSFLCRPDGELLACNAAFVRMLGFASTAEAMRCGLASLFPDAKSVAQTLDALRAHGRVRNVELEMRRGDGRSVRVIGSFVGTFHGHELHEIQGYLFDTTERRSLEDQLRQAQKMEAIGRLAGGVAHDFNNLLTVILGFSDMLLSRVGPSDPNAADLEEIQRAGVRAAALTKQLLAFSRRQVLEPTVLDVNAAVRAMSAMLGRLIGEDVHLVTHFAPDLGRVRADAGQLEQVIVNLVVNARDSMPKGGKLVIETLNVDVDDGRAMGGPAGSCVVIEVSDSGVGMDAETLAHLFEPFFTTKEQGKGTGLGLATVYGIVQQSGGFLDVSSTPGRGSCFRVFLPRVADEAGAPAPGAARPESSRGTETILVAEDEHAVRRLTRIALEAAGYEVLEASDGAAALDLLGRTDRPVSLLLTDVVMPGLNGPETAIRALRVKPGLKVLFMSGYADPEVATRGVTDAGWGLLRKPFAPAQLTQRVRLALDGGNVLGESGTWRLGG